MTAPDVREAVVAEFDRFEARVQNAAYWWSNNYVNLNGSLLTDLRETRTAVLAALDAAASEDSADPADGLSAEVIARIWREHSNCNWTADGVNVHWSCGIWHPGPLHMQPTTRDRHVAALLMTQIEADRTTTARQRPTQQAATDRVTCDDEHDGWLCTLNRGHGDHAAYGLPEDPPMASWPAATDRVVEALNEAADALEGTLGTASDPPRGLWEFRQWLRDRARALAAARDGAES